MDMFTFGMLNLAPFFSKQTRAEVQSKERGILGL